MNLNRIRFAAVLAGAGCWAAASGPTWLVNACGQALWVKVKASSSARGAKVTRIAEGHQVTQDVDDRTAFELAPGKAAQIEAQDGAPGGSVRASFTLLDRNQDDLLRGGELAYSLDGAGTQTLIYHPRAGFLEVVPQMLGRQPQVVQIMPKGSPAWLFDH